MNWRTSALGVLAWAFCLTSAWGQAQAAPEIRRAQPVNEPPVRRALPVEESTPRKAATPLPVATPAPTPRSTPVPAPEEPATPRSEPAASEGPEPEAADQRQLDYANALFNRKLYDLAIPEYEKFLGQFPNASGRASAFFYLAEAYRAQNRTAPARTAFQSVLADFSESEFAGPAAYGVGEILFNQKDYAGALAQFHRSAAKTKEPGLALSARYFEARSLENLDRKDEAATAYLQVIEAKDPNPFREDSRSAAASILFNRGRKAEALKQYEALANETGKAALKAEATVRAGLIAADLAQGEKGNKALSEKAVALLQKGRSLAEAGKWRGLAATGLLRVLYSGGQFQQVLTEWKRAGDDLPDDARAEMMLYAANSQRQLGHGPEAEALYAQIIEKYPCARRSEGRALPALDQCLQRRSRGGGRAGGRVFSQQLERRTGRPGAALESRGALSPGKFRRGRAAL